jgi:hypothetical protein
MPPNLVLTGDEIRNAGRSDDAFYDLVRKINHHFGGFVYLTTFHGITHYTFSKSRITGREEELVDADY